MAQNQLSVIGPRSEVHQQKTKEPDTLDRVLRGLQIANGVLGIGVDFTSIQKNMDERQQLADERAGIITRKQELDAQKGGLQQVPAGTAGSTAYTFGEGPDGGTAQRSYIAPPKETAIRTPGTREISTKNPDGSETKQIVPDIAGTKFESAAPKEKPARDITVSERNTLQSQYDRNPQVRANAMVVSSYEDARELMKDPSPASDQALIVAYVKAFDPTSVVKESEAETAQAMGSLMQRAEAKFAQMAGNGRLTDAQRADLFKQIQVKAKTAATRQAEIDKQFTGLATGRSVDPKDIRFSNMPKFDAEPTAAAPAGQPAAAAALAPPKVGDELDGYVFKGGDPKDQANWVKKLAGPQSIGTSTSILAVPGR